MPPCRACPPKLLRALVASVALAAAALWAPGGATLLAGTPSATADSVQSLRSSIATDRAHLRSVNGRIAAIEARVSALEDQLAARRSEQAAAHASLLRARARLLALEEELAAAGRALAANLRADYMGERPDAITVVLQAKGFSDLLERMQFLKRMRDHDVELVQLERRARLAVIAQASSMAKLEARERSLASTVLAQRNQVAAGKVSLVHERIAALHGLSGKEARLHTLERQLAAAQASQAAAARAGSGPSFAVVRDQPVQSGAGMPDAISRGIAAGNAIADLPYRFGGGHGSFHDSAYDCSGSVSYVLGAAGLLSAPLDSTGFESWGEAGPGRWITVYANSGHAWMTIAGRRFDTGGGGGSRWHSDSRDGSGFVARHPPGL
jgi:peptidoglycan hydrolase CwlO-like protein